MIILDEFNLKLSYENIDPFQMTQQYTFLTFMNL